MKSKMKFFLLAGLVSLFAVVACKDDDPDEVIGKLPQPELSIQPLVTGNQIDFLWLKVNGAKSYTLELSTDNFATSKTVEVTETDYTATGLVYNTVYSSRLRANSEVAEFNSAWVNMNDVTTGEREIPNVLSSVAADDIFGLDVTLRWFNAKYNATRIILEKADGTGSPLEFNVTAADQENGYKTLPELDRKTEYTATLYNDELGDVDNFYNTVSFKTGIYLAPGTILAASGNDLQQIIDDAADGAEIFLASNAKFTVGKVTITKSVRIFSDSEEPATVSNTGAWDISGSVEAIKFEDFMIEGNGTEFFLQDASSTHVGLLSFYGIKMSNQKSGLFDIKPSKPNYDLVVVDNCIISGNTTSKSYMLCLSSGSNLTGGAIAINEMEIKNSTFYNLQRGVVKSEAKKTGVVIANVLMENCTVYNVNLEGNKDSYTIRGAGNGGTTDGYTIATIKNCLFSKSNSNASGVMYIKGSLNFTEEFLINSYKTEDYVLNNTKFMNTSGDNPEVAAATAEDIFTDPAKFNFTLKNQTLINNKIGDPRWWPAQ